MRWRMIVTLSRNRIKVNIRLGFTVSQLENSGCFRRESLIYLERFSQTLRVLAVQR